MFFVSISMNTNQVLSDVDIAIVISMLKKYL